MRMSCPACVPAITQDIDNVIIRNLVIRNMPQRGIYASLSPGSLDDRVQRYRAGQIGVFVSSGSVVRNNFIHGNTSGGYLVWKASNMSSKNNQIAYNGPGQKIALFPPT